MSGPLFPMVVRPDGTIHCLYAEPFDLRALGSLQIARGSHVEPANDGQWWVDLSPADGPQLGPFRLRSAALWAEQQWLEAHWLLASPAHVPADSSVTG